MVENGICPSKVLTSDLKAMPGMEDLFLRGRDGQVWIRRFRGLSLGHLGYLRMVQGMSEKAPHGVIDPL